MAEVAVNVTATLSAVVTRADGTVEDLGVISTTVDVGDDPPGDDEEEVAG